MWTELIDTYSSVQADWVPDIVGRCAAHSTSLGNFQVGANAYVYAWHIIRCCSQPHSGSTFQKLFCHCLNRALGNRGNARTRQGRLQAAIGDFNTAIKLCPWAVDPVLNR